jgi:hypothetical protein
MTDLKKNAKLETTALEGHRWGVEGGKPMPLTEKDIAELIAEFGPIVRKPPTVKPKSDPPKGEVVQLAAKTVLSIEGQREAIERRTAELIRREKATLGAAEHNRALLAEIRRTGEWHALQKQAHMEAEYWAMQAARGGGVYSPIARFDREMGDNVD